MSHKITYNAPVVLTYTLCCSIAFVLNTISGQTLSPLMSLSANFSIFNLVDLFTLFTYTFGHSGWDHLLGNLTFILLLGPALEEKYGSQNLLFMLVVTAVVTALLNTLLFSVGLWGASGIVFLFIVLNSFTGFKDNEIPLSFILIAILFVGKEVSNSFKPDNISQFAHILGGICGGAFGFLLNRRRSD